MEKPLKQLCVATILPSQWYFVCQEQVNGYEENIRKTSVYQNCPAADGKTLRWPCETGQCTKKRLYKPHRSISYQTPIFNFLPNQLLKIPCSYYQKCKNTRFVNRYEKLFIFPQESHATCMFLCCYIMLIFIAFQDIFRMVLLLLYQYSIVSHEIKIDILASPQTRSLVY